MSVDNFNIDNKVRYFEFEIIQRKSMNYEGEKLTLLSIKDITSVIKGQQVLCDEVY